MYSRPRRLAQYERVVEDPVVIERRRKESQISLLLHRLNDSVTGYGGSPQTGQTMEEFEQRLVLPRMFEITRPLRAARLLDGVAIVFSSKSRWEDNTHLLLLGKDAEPRYEREAVNVDCQAMPTQKIELVRLEQFVDNKDIIGTLKYCAGALAVEASYGWKHSYLPIAE